MLGSFIWIIIAIWSFCAILVVVFRTTQIGRRSTKQWSTTTEKSIELLHEAIEAIEAIEIERKKYGELLSETDRLRNQVDNIKKHVDPAKSQVEKIVDHIEERVNIAECQVYNIDIDGPLGTFVATELAKRINIKNNNKVYPVLILGDLPIQADGFIMQKYFPAFDTKVVVDLNFTEKLLFSRVEESRTREITYICVSRNPIPIVRRMAAEVADWVIQITSDRMLSIVPKNDYTKNVFFCQI